MLKLGFFLALCITLNSSIYSYTIVGANGVSIDFNGFRNKKILLVNIATNSQRADQIGELEELYQLYGDSLVVIAFPSNSFGNEPRSNAEIAAYCTTNYNSSFVIAGKNAVAGSGIQPIYEWLASPALNGVLMGTVSNDFQKFLIDKNGVIAGVFAPMISPMDSIIQKAILGIE